MFGKLENQFAMLNLDDKYAENVALVSNLPSNSWFEGFALRPNGDGLAARLDAPELYSYNSQNPDAELELLYTFPLEEATGVINICALKGAPDEYVVLTGFVNMAEVNFENFLLWRLKLHPDDAEPPVVTKMTVIPDIGFAIGLTPATERTLLIADSAKACVWRLDLASGRTEELYGDALMEAASKEDFFGLNRMRVAGGYVWFTNSSAGILGRFPVRIREGDVPEGEWDIEATDGVDIIAADIPHCDGLELNDDQTAAFTSSYLGGFLWKVDIDKETGAGKTSIILQHLVSPTSVEMRYVDGKPRLHVVSCGQIEHGWVNEDDRASWSDIANINNAVSVEVTVTEEVVESA